MTTTKCPTGNYDKTYSPQVSTSRLQYAYTWEDKGPIIYKAKQNINKSFKPKEHFTKKKKKKKPPPKTKTKIKTTKGKKNDKKPWSKATRNRLLLSQTKFSLMKVYLVKKDFL